MIGINNARMTILPQSVDVDTKPPPRSQMRGPANRGQDRKPF